MPKFPNTATPPGVYDNMRFRSFQALGLPSLAILLPLLLGAAPQSTQSNQSSQSTQAGHTTQQAEKPTGPEGSIPMPADRAADSYAIYSMLMPGQEFAGMAPELNARWAIAAITVNEDDRNPAIPPQGQLKPPPDHPHRFEEAVSDYQTNRYVRVELTQKPFQISHPFDLLAPAQIDELRAAKTAPTATGEARSAWAGYPGVTFFSEVYFDSKHTAALVYMNDWCAHLCATGSWIYLEKQDGRWQRRSGIVVPGA